MLKFNIISFLFYCISILQIKSQQFNRGNDYSDMPKEGKNLGRNKPQNYQPDKIIKPLKQIPIDELPENFFWGDIDGVNYLTQARNQFVPHYCGSCWAHGTAHAMSDRIKIMRNATWPDINISVQVLVSCAHGDDYPILSGCDGGYAYDGYRWISEYNITDDTCSTYHAWGWNNEPNPLGCTDLMKCQNCNENNECKPQQNAKIYTIKEYGHVKGEEAMMNEIYQRGTITCGVAAIRDWYNYTEGVYVSPFNHTDSNHDVNIMGWGVENGTKYWWGRNFFGSHWGIHGYFKLIRGEGTPNLNIEDDCHFGVPLDTWTDDLRNTTEPEQQQQQNKQKEETEPCYIPHNEDDHQQYMPEMPQQLKRFLNSKLKKDNIPKQWDWRNANGQNYMSWNVNAGVPKVCGSCWAFAAASAIADRIQIMRGNAWPTIALNPQVLINCKAGGSCKGGNSLGAYKFMKSHGIPELTCQQYMGQDPVKEEVCNPKKVCMSSQWPTEHPLTWPITYYQNWYIQEFGTVSGSESMKKEVYKNGSISCGIQATDLLRKFDGKGIFSQQLDNISLNYEITIVGFGVDEEDGSEYWICRNFWGTTWGDFGFFKLKMHSDNLGVETKCAWGKPILTY